MKNFNILTIAVLFVFLSCSKDNAIVDETTQLEQSDGYNMLLIGNSFFRPYAENLLTVAHAAGFENHSAT